MIAEFDIWVVNKTHTVFKGMKESERPLHKVMHLPVLPSSVGMTNGDTYFPISALLRKKGITQNTKKQPHEGQFHPKIKLWT